MQLSFEFNPNKIEYVARVVYPPHKPTTLVLDSIGEGIGATFFKELNCYVFFKLPLGNR